MDAVEAFDVAIASTFTREYSQQCTEDLASIQYALGQVLGNPMKYFWAVNCK